MKIISLRIKIIVPFIIALALLLSSFVYRTSSDQFKEFSNEVETHLDYVVGLFEKQVTSESQLLSAIIDMLSKTPELQNAWRAKDRKALLSLSQPILEQFGNKFKITHFYFHDINRRNFLRVYNPERFGDTINRYTILEAEKTGETISGVELGKLGTLTLRVVQPWRIDGEIVGYIEMGEEIDHIIEKLHDILNVELYVSIYKEYLTRESWAKGAKIFDHLNNWDQLPDSVIVLNTTDNVPASFSDFLSKGEHSYMEMDTNMQLTFDNKNYRIGVIPLHDAGNREIGDIVILYDVTKQLAESETAVLQTILLYLAVAIVLIAFFYTLLQKIEMGFSLIRITWKSSWKIAQMIYPL